jgi:uncharacterized protein YgbK (DUF1537 family)
MSPWLGVVADDFTGATDLAGMLVREGLRTVQFFGVPPEDAVIPDVDCLVVALKSRACPVDEAVRDSLAAARWLAAQGIEKFFFKYCSTFDSTPQGNIGPVAEALAEEVGSAMTLICPAAIENRRTIYGGNLFVGGVPLAESPMKDHPLNPMWDSSLPRLFEAQSNSKVGLVPWETVQEGSAAITTAIDTLAEDGNSFVVTDALTVDDLVAIADATAPLKLVSGAAGLGVGIARVRVGDNRPDAADVLVPAGPAVALSGSCSTATQGQVALHKADYPAYEIDVYRLDAGEPVVAEAIQFIEGNLGNIPLVYSSASPDVVDKIQADLGVERSAHLVEDAFAEIAKACATAGVRRFVIAGGETSGAIVSALGVRAIQIGREVDPGVPWTVSLGEPALGLLLKSGNFGAPDIFTKALRIADEH